MKRALVRLSFFTASNCKGFTLADIRILELPLATGPTAPAPSDVVAIDGTTTRRTPISAIADAVRPVASQAEAEAGINATKVMSSVNVKQSISSQIGVTLASSAQGLLASSAMQPSVYDSASKGFNVYAQAFRDDSPRYYGAVGDGTTNDATNYAATETAKASVFLPSGASFNLGSALPTKPVLGDGKLVIGGIEVGGFQMQVEADRGNIFFSPGLYYDPPINTSTPVIGNTTPPTISGVQRYSNVFITPGASSYVKDRMWRDTVVGEGAFRIMEDAERSEAFGNSAFGFARYSERNTGVGSLVMQWLGQNLSRDATNYYTHDIWYNGGVTINDPAWNYENLATQDPTGTLRTTLVAYTDWAATRDDVANNVAVGRDAVLHLLKGSNNTGVGYRAGQKGINVTSNSWFGYRAGQDNLWGIENAGIGSSAGYLNQIGSGNFYAGHASGSGLNGGDNNVIVGRNAGAQTTLIQASGNIWIGRDAGRNLNVNTNDTFILQNLSSRLPLLSGDFAAPKVGINMPLGDVKATLHVRTAYFGANVGANSGADELVIENNGAAGLSVRTPNTAVGSFLFADPEGSGQGGMQYTHSTDSLALRAANATRAQIGLGVIIGSTGAFMGDGTLNVIADIYRTGTKVVGARETGYIAMTGTANKATVYDVATVTLPQLAARVAALQASITTHGLIGA